jgi:hypothetical protein
MYTHITYRKTHAVHCHDMCCMLLQFINDVYKQHSTGGSINTMHYVVQRLTTFCADFCGFVMCMYDHSGKVYVHCTRGTHA